MLSAVAVGALVLGIHEGPEHGWTSTLAVVGVIGGLLALCAFVWWELRQERPLLDLRVFANRALAGGSLSLLVTFAVMFGLFLAMIQFLQAVLGYSAVRAAVGLLPMAAAMMPLSTVAPQIAKRVGLRVMLAGGGLIMAFGLVLLGTFANADNGYLGILPGLVVLGLGVGLAMSPGTEAITSSLPEERQGVASALNDTVREFGGALGVALMGSLLSAGYSAHIGAVTAGLPADLAATVNDGIGGAFVVAPQLGASAPAVIAGARDAFVHGWQLAMWFGAALLFASAVFSAVWVPRRERALELESELDRSELALAGVD